MPAGVCTSSTSRSPREIRRIAPAGNAARSRSGSKAASAVPVAWSRGGNGAGWSVIAPDRTARGVVGEEGRMDRRQSVADASEPHRCVAGARGAQLVTAVDRSGSSLRARATTNARIVVTTPIWKAAETAMLKA